MVRTGGRKPCLWVVVAAVVAAAPAMAAGPATGSGTPVGPHSASPDNPAAVKGTESPDRSVELPPGSAKQADDLSWWTVDSGGGVATGGDLALEATIGQPEEGTATGGGWAFSGGLWAGEVDSGHIFYDGFESGDTSGWSAVAGDSP